VRKQRSVGGIWVCSAVLVVVARACEELDFVVSRCFFWERRLGLVGAQGHGVG